MKMRVREVYVTLPPDCLSILPLTLLEKLNSCGETQTRKAAWRCRLQPRDTKHHWVSVFMLGWRETYLVRPFIFFMDNLFSVVSSVIGCGI